jgi:hypothetical protein
MKHNKMFLNGIRSFNKFIGFGNVRYLSSKVIRHNPQKEKKVVDQKVKKEIDQKQHQQQPSNQQSQIKQNNVPHLNSPKNKDSTKITDLPNQKTNPNVDSNSNEKQSNQTNKEKKSEIPKWIKTFETFYHLDFSGNSKRLSQSQQMFHKTAAHCDLSLWYKPLTKKELIELQELRNQQEQTKNNITTEMNESKSAKEEKTTNTRISSYQAEVESKLTGVENIEKLLEIKKGLLTQEKNDQKIQLADEIKDQTELVFATDLPPSFYSWYKITLLHMWLLFVRLRLLKKGGNEMAQALLDRFWEDMEYRQKGLGVR